MCERQMVFGDLDERQLLSLAGYYEHRAPNRDGGMTGKRVLVLGADHGLGERLVVGLARRGATVVMVARDRRQGEAARDRIRRVTGNSSVDLMLADLSVQASVRQLAAEYRSRHGQLHVLINSPWAMSPRWTLTPDGIERTLAINHVAPFLLTSMLLDLLRAGVPSRIVNVTSRAHGFRKLDLANLQNEADYEPQRMFAQSKLVNLLYTFELARRLAGSGVTVNAADPGITWMASQAPPLARGGALSAFQPEAEAATPLYLAVSSEVHGVSGGYFVGKRRSEPSARALDRTLAQAVWHITEQLAGLGQAALASAPALVVDTLMAG